MDSHDELRKLLDKANKNLIVDFAAVKPTGDIHFGTFNGWLVIFYGNNRTGLAEYVNSRYFLWRGKLSLGTSETPRLIKRMDLLSSKEMERLEALWSI